MKLLRCLFAFLFMLSLVSFSAGCSGGGEESENLDDELMQDDPEDLSVDDDEMMEDDPGGGDAP